MSSLFDYKPIEKTCTKCRIIKPMDQFFTDNQRSDGKCPYCRTCRAGTYRRNSTRILKQYSEYREANAERLLAQKKAYDHRRFFYKRAANLLGRASIKADGSRKLLKSRCAEISRLWKQQKGVCPLSGRRLNRNNAQLDHIVSASAGGSSDISNLRWVHRDVNYAKRDLTDEQLMSLCVDIVNYSGKA